VQAHANDLRSEVARDWNTLVDVTAAASGPPEGATLDALVHQVARDWREAPLSAGVQRLLEYAEKVTRTPAGCTATDVDRLRSAGWSDRAIHDAVQIVAYFNYINRVVDALGVEPEPDFRDWGSGGAGGLTSRSGKGP